MADVNVRAGTSERDRHCCRHGVGDCSGHRGPNAGGWCVVAYVVLEERFFDRAYETGWRAAYVLEAIAEHAVMHVIRHAFQLEELMTGSGR